ncbi:MAG TPA: DUF6798 domain-containing protein, partial [Gemmataceae bacterium]|nr:DUF6798 domain-containing protein [Gemmataceae bacterium]
ALPSGRALRAALFLHAAALFAFAYCEAPLYYSNQNQYFLHGLAAAGDGLLREDWLAGTRDPTPAFSALVAFTVRFLHPWAFYAYHALLLGAYTVAMFGLFAAVAGREVTRRRWPVFVVLFVAAHAALPRWLSYRWLGHDYPWFLQAGVAGQYVLGAMLQPSAFGVLLVVAVCLFVRSRPYLAALCTAAAATAHATYLLPGALLTLGFLTALLREGRRKEALALGAFTLVLVLPITVYTLLAFRPSSPETFARAQEILVNDRIPHHTRPDLWLDPVAAAQIAWALLGVVLARPGRLRVTLAVAFALSAALTLVQVATGSLALALLFPWRVSSVLVPIATTVVLSRLVAIRAVPLEGGAAGVVAAAIVAALVGAGVWIMVGRLAFYTDPDELAVMNFVRRTKRPGDVYFLPVRVPDLAKTTRGSLSSDFKPLPDKQSDRRVIPVDLQRFRLYTGAPIFVDFKSVPYKDADVLEWYKRLGLAQAALEELREGRLSKALDELRARGITHLVLPAPSELRGPEIEQVYGDTHYRVYRVLRSGGLPRSE